MLRRFQSLWRSGFVATDIALSLSVFLFSYHLRFHPAVTAWLPLSAPLPPLELYLRLLPVLALIVLVSNHYHRLYTPRREGSLLSEFGDLVKATVLAVVLFTAFLFFERTFSYARGIIGIFVVLNPVMAFGLRAVVRTVLRHARRRGYNLRHVLIAGTGRTAQALIHRIRRNPWTGLRIAGLVGDSPDRVGKKIHGIELVGTIGEIEKAVERSGADQVFIALPPHRAEEIEPLVRTLTAQMVDIRLIPDLGVLLGLNYRTVDFDGLPIVSLWESPVHGWSAVMKRAMDFGLALTAIVFSFPLLLVVGLAVKLTSRGPILYRQERVGLDGRVFSIIKFRTMRAGAAEGEEPGWTRPGDPRCTPLGRFLRRTSLDELPQLFNVLWGQMSLVGPRPERPVYIEKFKRSIPHYMLRHKVKAGITGWAQVNGWRGDTSLKKRIQYDLYYLEHWSLGFDLKILALTLLRGLAHPNAY